MVAQFFFAAQTGYLMTRGERQRYEESDHHSKVFPACFESKTHLEVLETAQALNPGQRTVVQIKVRQALE